MSVVLWTTLDRHEYSLVYRIALHPNLYISAMLGMSVRVLHIFRALPQFSRLFRGVMSGIAGTICPERYLATLSQRVVA